MREIENSLRTAERNIIRDMGKYMPPNVSDPKAWMRQNAGPDALGNLRKKATELQEPQRSRWLANLDKPSWRAQITNRTALYKRIEMEGLTTQRSIDRTLGTALRGAAAEGYARQMFEVQKGAGIGWAFDLPNTRQADAMARRVMDTKYTSNLTKRHSAAIKEQITGGILSGSSVNDIAKRINETAGNEIWEAKRLVRTEITGAAAEGELEALRDMEEEFGIKMRYRFYATLDERTCPVCGALDMQDFSPDDAEEGVNKPPMHPNCRCVIQPVMDDEKKEEIVRRGRDESGKNAVMPKGMTYAKWREEYVRKPEAVPERDIAEELRKSAGIEQPPDETLKRMAQGVADAPRIQAEEELQKLFNENPFKDIKDNDMEALQKVAEQTFGVKVTLPEKADFKLLKDSLGNMAKVANEHPQLKTAFEKITLEGVQSDGEPIDSGTAAAVEIVGVDENGKQRMWLHLNPTLYGDRRDLQAYIDGANNWAKTNFNIPYFTEGTTPENIIVHESGHALHNIAAFKSNNEYVDFVKARDLGIITDKELQQYMIHEKNKFCEDLIIKATDAHRSTISTPEEHEELRNGLSYYAETNSREKIAEAVNNVRSNGMKSYSLNRTIYKLLNEYLR